MSIPTKQNLCREYTITPAEPNNVFKAKYGTFDKENPKVLYLNAKAKVIPINKKTNYASDIRHVKRQFDEYINTFFRDTDKYSQNFIYSCDVSEENITFGKKSNLKYEVLVRPLVPKTIDEYMPDMVELSDTFSMKLSQFMVEGAFEVS